jgi:hypothetical protein
VKSFISGMMVMGYVTAALFFAKYSARTRDAFFSAFAVAFGLLAIQRVALTIYQDSDGPVWTYVLRLAAFVVILLAIAGKNVLPRRRVQ